MFLFIFCDDILSIIIVVVVEYSNFLSSINYGDFPMWFKNAVHHRAIRLLVIIYCEKTRKPCASNLTVSLNHTTVIIYIEYYPFYQFKEK